MFGKTTYERNKENHMIDKLLLMHDMTRMINDQRILEKDNKQIA